MIKKSKNTKYNKNFKRYVLCDTCYTIRGFTLIELLVTIGIAALLMVAAVPGFRNYRNLNDLNNNAKIVQSEIYKARSFALAPDTNKKSGNNYYYADIGANSIGIYECSGVFALGIVTCEEDSINKVESFNLPKNIEVGLQSGGIPPAGIQIFYSIEKYGRIDYMTGAADISLDLTMTNTKDNKSKILNINKVTGQVSIK